MLTIIERLQGLNRSLLKRLRPMALGNVPLADLLAQIVHERTREHPEMSFQFSAERLGDSYGDSIDLTIYRCAQEGLTNAIRHANATHVAVSIGELAGDHDHAGPHLRLIVRDDGFGMGARTPPGFGLRGMQERVQALGGDCRIEGRPRLGTTVTIAIPLQPRQQDVRRPAIREAR
jgi:two-component system sensor histidine kinase UhpB